MNTNEQRPKKAAQDCRRTFCWKNFRRVIPNLAVFLLLGGIIYAGHITGWKMPSFSELTGNARQTDSLWCGDHLVPEPECVECQPELLPKNEPFGFCNNHGVAECVNDHPELAQVIGTPQLPKYNTVEAVSLITRSENSSRDTLHTKRVQFATAEAVLKAGIAVDIAGEGPVTEVITANGELTFDPYSVAMLSSKAQGTVAAVLKHIGDNVKTGEVLALIDASQVGQLKSELIKNIVQIHIQKDNLQRLKAAGKAVSEQELIQGGAAVDQAEVALISTKQLLANLGFTLPEFQETDKPAVLSGRLQYLGIPESVVQQLPPTAKNANLLPIIAPFDGVVAASDIVLGTLADTTKTLITVCDPQQLWMMLNIRQEDAPYVHVGQQVHFTSDNGSQKASGTISWVAPSVDEKTRTLQTRAEVANPGGKLRNHIFGSGRIVLREESQAVLVPQEAVQATADSQFVFVRDKDFFKENHPKIFYVRQVRLGTKSGRSIEILAGVLPGEVVATKGSNVLLAHLLRSNLGAGCCAEH
ncbi:MAG: efflux RND transporter periplasmic adaptor subunit [Planctomycetaceae bacterium]|jgi:cobalt-zinc-cadmium efflux system membrane fusion protein|nr:efflux RND transporter periplasmic adaptor subunit [Planctomycetaceae bacterium]